jgi:hypothetical protein
MHDSADFTLRITVMAPERAVDDYAPTAPFERPKGLPGVTGRPAPRPQPPQQPPRPMPRRAISTSAPTAPTLQAEAPKVMAPSIPSPTAASALVRLTAGGMIDVPPPPRPTPRAEPLSDDEEDRVLRRARAHKKIAWARQMLRKFNFEELA